jgi:hypothetical protein
MTVSRIKPTSQVRRCSRPAGLAGCHHESLADDPKPAEGGAMPRGTADLLLVSWTDLAKRYRPPNESYGLRIAPACDLAAAKTAMVDNVRLSVFEGCHPHDPDIRSTAVSPRAGPPGTRASSSVSCSRFATSWLLSCSSILRARLMLLAMSTSSARDISELARPQATGIAGTIRGGAQNRRSALSVKRIRASVLR